MSTAAQVIEQVRVIVKAPAESGAPVPTVLRVGERSHWALSDAAGWRSAHQGKLLTALFGVPIEATKLDHGWQLLDGAGAVIAEGEIDGP